MHRVFGVKENAEYRDREGAYIIPVRGDKVGVVRTHKGYFLVGGGIEDGESHTDCLVRECREETGYTVAVGERLCTAETYLFHSSIGYFHPIQTYYRGEFIAQETAPTESDHEFMWVRYDDIKGKMFFEMQDWALKKALEKRCGSYPYRKEIISTPRIPRSANSSSRRKRQCLTAAVQRDIISAYIEQE
ncbi:MAG: NUDIX domain-containing protein [Ruminococcus sp.]|nr:NUDIX domain-containing protein [Ruminococcus sp.]